MEALTFLLGCYADGIRLRWANGKLTGQGPPGKLTPERREFLRGPEREAVIAYLADADALLRDLMEAFRRSSGPGRSETSEADGGSSPCSRTYRLEEMVEVIFTFTPAEMQAYVQELTHPPADAPPWNQDWVALGLATVLRPELWSVESSPGAD